MQETLKENQKMPVLLMAEPRYFAIEKPFEDGHVPANDFSVEGYREYAADPEAFVAKAVKQWSRLRDIFNELGVKTIVLKSDPSNPDQVFTADPSFSLKTEKGTLVTIFSRFSNEGRQAEVADQLAFFKTEKPDNVFFKAPFRTEGTGDNIYDALRDVYWSGYTNTPGREGAASGRSDKQAHKVLEQVTGVEVISLEVKEPFFHIDTSLAPLPSGHIICYRGGMSDEAFEEMRQKAFDRYGLPRDEYLIEVTKKDAEAYACNLRCIGDTVVMPLCSQSLQDKLAGIGYKVITTDLSQFIRTGGAVHCLTNNINEIRVPGGTISKLASRSAMVV